MSAKIGTYDRMITLEVVAVEAGGEAPSPTAVKVATDAETNLDVYVDNPTFSWLKTA